MAMSRRGFLGAGAAFAGAVATKQLSWGQSATPAPTLPEAKTPAALALRKEIGDEQWTELFARLSKTNSDIKLKGLKTIDGKSDAGGDFLTGYPYTEFYD